MSHPSDMARLRSCNACGFRYDVAKGACEWCGVGLNYSQPASLIPNLERLVLQAARRRVLQTNPRLNRQTP